MAVDFKRLFARSAPVLQLFFNIFCLPVAFAHHARHGMSSTPAFQPSGSAALQISRKASLAVTPVALLGLMPPVSVASSTTRTAPPSLPKEVDGGPTLREKGRPPLLEALVYLPKGVNYWGQLVPESKNSAPDSIAVAGTGTEALFLTASFQNKLILGARVPMQGIMFPFLAQFYEDNILGGKNIWEGVKSKDLVVRARVCSSGSYPPCNVPLLKAASLSKFFPEVRDPNTPESAEVIARNVRIGASLMLQPVTESTTLERMRVMDGGLDRIRREL